MSSPAEADLIFEISWVLTDTGLKLPVLGQLRLLVVDPKTRVTLWNFTEYVRGALLLRNRDKNFDRAINTIVDRLKKLMNAPAATGDASPTNTPPSYRSVRIRQLLLRKPSGWEGETL